MIITISTGDKTPTVDLKITWQEAQALKNLVSFALTIMPLAAGGIERQVGDQYTRTLNKIKIG